MSSLPSQSQPAGVLGRAVVLTISDLRSRGERPDLSGLAAAMLRRTPLAALSRAGSGVCGQALVVNLPGSPEGAVTSLEAVLEPAPHALTLLSGEDAHAETGEASRA